MVHQTLEAFWQIVLLQGVKTSCTSHIFSKIKCEALSRSTPLILLKNIVTSGVNEERGLSIEPREEIQNRKKRHPIVIFEETIPYCPEWLVQEAKTGVISKGIKSLESVLNAHKGRFAWSPRTPTLADKGGPSSLNRGTYHAWLSRLPWVLVIHLDQTQPSPCTLKPPDINHSDILFDRQWTNKNREHTHETFTQWEPSEAT